MARIHVIYDPNDKLTSQSEHMDKIGIKVAIMPLLDDAGYLDIKQTTEKVVSLFLMNLGYKVP